MVGLLYKEFIQNRRNLALIGGTLMIFSSIMFIPEPEGFEEIWTLLGLIVYVPIFALTGDMFQSSIFESDESKKWAYFIASSPMTVKGQVGSKYWFTLLTSYAVLVWCAVCDAISCAVHDNPNSMISLIVMLFFIQIMMRAVEMPFIIRFGSKIGAVYKGIVFSVLIFAVIVYLLFGDLSKFGSVENFYSWFFKMMSGGSNGMLIFSAALPYVSVGLYYLSYRLSCGFYMKGAENYDK